jgi:hypothetical protein
MFQTKAVEKLITHILCSVTFFQNRTVYEVMWKHSVQPGRPQMIIWRMRIEWWVTQATNTHSQYVILFAFPPQQWLHEHASMLRYTYCALCCVVLFEECATYKKAMNYNTFCI